MAPNRTLLLVGEAHGVAACMPAVLARVAEERVPCALGFEWSHDEVDPLVEAFRASGVFDIDGLWQLPPGAEVFGGDGRFTAGHVALLERLWRARSLTQVIAFDRLDPEPPAPWHDRDRDMAGRLVERWDTSHPLIAVVGAAHAVSSPGTMADLLGVDAAMFDYGSDVRMPAAALTIPVPSGPPPVVPGRYDLRPMHLRAPAFDHGVISFLWALFFGLLIWIGGAAVGYSSAVTFIVGCVAGFLIFLFVRVYGEDEPRRP